MCRLSFFAPSTTVLADLLNARVASLQDLQTKGFRDTDSAARYLRLEREIGYLTTPMVEQPYENMFYVNTSPDLATTITLLQTAAASMTAAPESTIRQYLQNQTRRTQLASYQKEMDSLLAEAQANLSASSSNSVESWAE
ncbi:MAG: hypothetical protein PHG66_04605 [Candidatus Colwellbacteria bacterium]|nr:hypothetical protein [Candidatus Colwellbacteria bacterium]